MRVEHYRKWLAANGKKPDYITRFVHQATANTEKTCLGWAVREGLCPAGQTLLDLSASELYALRAQGSNLPNHLRTYLSACLQFVAAQMAPVSSDPGALTLALLVHELQQICPLEVAEPLLGALVLDESFAFSNLTQRWELKPNATEYITCRAVILEHLATRYDDIRTQFIRAVHPALKQAEPYGGSIPLLLADLRSGYVLLAEHLKQKLSKRPGWSGSAAEELLLRMEGWRPNYSTGTKQDDTTLDWYAALEADELEAHCADTFLSLVELSLRHEGDTPASPRPITGLTNTDKLYYTLFAPFDRLLTLRLVKEAGITTAQIARLLRMGLFRVERMPKQGTSCLRLAPAALQTLSQEPTISPDDPSCLELLWHDDQLLNILLKLLAELERTSQSAAHIFERGPELIAMLATAPQETPSNDESAQPPPALASTLETLLAGVDSLSPLSESTRKDLLGALAALRKKDHVIEAVDKLAALLVSCHWEVIQTGPSPDSAESLQRLIDLYRMRPRTVTKALAPLWEHRDSRPGDWERRSQITAGDSLLLCELYGHSAADCLALAEESTLSPAVRLSWANRARSDAHCSAQMALRLNEGLRSFDAQLLQAKALAHLATLSAATNTEGAELFTDSIAPCAQAVLDCYKLLDEVLPEQAKALSGNARNAFEEHSLMRQFSFVQTRADLHAKLFSPPVAAALQKHTGLWAAIPHSCKDQNDWRTLAKTRLHVPADDAVQPEVPTVPTLWLPAPQKTRVFLPYYCSYLDSETTKRKQYQPGRIEAYLLKTILSMEDVVLTANQAVDNAIIRALAYQPGFRQMLRTGHITVSFFWGYYSLCQYAAAKLLDSNFIWSSLPHEFNHDPNARRAASEYLNGTRTAAHLPLAYRELIIRFREELTLLDENLPARSKAHAYQYPNSGRGTTSLSRKLDTFFLPRQGDPKLADLCRLHFLLLSPDATEDARKKLIRSQYQKCLDALKNGNLAFLKDMEGLCDPAVYQPGSHQRAALESYTDPGKHETLALMQTVLSSRHNEMLGALCTDHQHHIYSEAERLILPYDETSPINQGGCRLFQDTVTTTETGVRFGWDQAPEFLARSESILHQHPGISPDELAGKLAGNELDYTISADGGALWLARGTVQTSQRQSLLVELRPHTGTIHLQTEGA